MEVTLEEKQVRRAYALFSPVYDVLFNKIFEQGRVEAVAALEIRAGDRVLEVGIGTGLNLPLYPSNCSMVGIDLSAKMLRKAQEKILELGMERAASLHLMDASRMTFPDDSFDHALAAYVISAVPDPVAVLLEMKRVVKTGGSIVFINHFKSERRVIGGLEEAIAPICTRFGFKTNLELSPLLQAVNLTPEAMRKVNLLKGWHLIKCRNQK